MSKFPHICFVSDTIHTYFGSERKKGIGGAERQQYLIANQLHAKGFPVSVITLDHGHDQSPQSYDGVAVWNTIPDKRGLLNAPFKSISVLTALWKVDADIYYVRGNDFLCMVVGQYCRFTDAKFVYAVANDSNVEPDFLRKHNPVFRKLYLSSMASADAVTVLTPYQQDVLNRCHDIDSIVIPCGYDLPKNENVLDHKKREFVLWVGRLDHDQKKPERYLRLARENPAIPFVMIGPPDNDDQDLNYFNEIQKQAKQIDNLEFIEFVPPDEIHEYFRKASLLVNTSDYEGFGNIFLESWRYATPVVTLHYTLHGVINNENIGVHAESMDELSRIVANLHNNPKRRREMGSAGRELVRREYSLRTVLNQYCEVFRNF